MSNLDTPETNPTLQQGYDDIISLIQTIPDAAIDWSPAENEWSLKRVIGHLAHANDFYVMIAQEARRANFSQVDLNQDLEGKQRMHETDMAIDACTTTAMLLAVLERTYQRMVNELQTLTPEELERSFTITERANTRTTTLQRRVFESATYHFYEHQPQIAETLAGWSAAASAPYSDVNERNG